MSLYDSYLVKLAMSDKDRQRLFENEARSERERYMLMGGAGGAILGISAYDTAKNALKAKHSNALAAAAGIGGLVGGARLGLHLHGKNTKYISADEAHRRAAEYRLKKRT